MLLCENIVGLIYKNNLNGWKTTDHEGDVSTKQNANNTLSAMDHLLCEVIYVEFVGVGYL